MNITVTGAGGFIGHHLTKRLKQLGHKVRGVDIKMPEYEASPADEFLVADLRHFQNACSAIWKYEDRVYHLAANMGGIGFIENHKAEIVRDNTMIDLSVLEASKHLNVGRVFYASSACVYPSYKQNQTDILPLMEEEAYPADPEDGYGWEKLYAERMCRHYREDFKLETRVARFHNIYGPLGAYDGGREKSPAAICRKIAAVKDGGEIEVWGDGNQTRSYCHVDDCVEGVIRLMESDCHDPVNIGRDDIVSINHLVDLVAGIAGKKVKIRYDLTKPKGVRGRNADLTMLKKRLGWTPVIDMATGLRSTYAWIAGQVGGTRVFTAR